MDIAALLDRFGADGGSVIELGHSSATVVRLERSSERLYYKAGPGVSADGDRLAWLGEDGFPCPRIVDRGNNWLLTAELPGRDAWQPWAAGDRPAVLAAIAAGLRALDSLTGRPFTSPFPDAGDAVTHGNYAAPNVFVELYGGDPDDQRIEHYITLDDTYLP